MCIRDRSKSSSGIGGGLTDPTVPGWTTGMSTSTGKGHSMSGTGSVHYAFGSKYAFDFTIRADGSTKFGSCLLYTSLPGAVVRDEHPALAIGVTHDQ